MYENLLTVGTGFREMAHTDQRTFCQETSGG